MNDKVAVYASWNGKSHKLHRYDDVHPILAGHVWRLVAPETGEVQARYEAQQGKSLYQPSMRKAWEFEDYALRLWA